MVSCGFHHDNSQGMCKQACAKSWCLCQQKAMQSIPLLLLLLLMLVVQLHLLRDLLLSCALNT
jgi:hypothetical protein